jgi:hypothetical protein
VLVPGEKERLAVDVAQLHPRRPREHALAEARVDAVAAAPILGRGHAGAAEEHPGQHRGPGLLPPLDHRGTHHLHRRAVEQERRDAVQISRVEGGAEGVEGGGHRRAIGLELGVGELAPAAMKGCLHRADGGGEDVCDVLEGDIESVLEHNRRSLLGGELDQERPGGLANVAGRCTVLRVRRWGRGRATAHPVDPEVRGHAEHPGPQVSRRFLERAERGERLGERVLHEVLGVPGAPERFRQYR